MTTKKIENAWDVVISLSKDEALPYTYQQLGVAVYNCLNSYSEADLTLALLEGKEAVIRTDNNTKTLLSVLAMFGLETLIEGLRTGKIKLEGDSDSV